jgi:5-methylcytosine-specific restriction endonuclease McrA
MANAGDGGLIHLIYQDCLLSKTNRKKRKQIYNYRAILKKLLEKYNFKCAWCGCDENLTIDHIKPVSAGGDDLVSNLQILCKSCNSKKGATWDEKAKEPSSL